MARILFTSTLGGSPWAGSEVLWYQAASLLVTKGHRVASVLPAQMHVAATRDRLSSAGITLLGGMSDRFRALSVRVARRIRPGGPTVLAPVVKHARRWKADLVVFSQASCWGAYSEMLALSEASIPFVCISQLNTPFSWLRDDLFEAVGRAFTGARAAVFVSKGNLNLFQNQVALELENAHVIYNPPSFDVSVPVGPPDASAFHLLNVARIDPGHKGQDLLLDVLAMPKWRERDVVLSIAGGGSQLWLEQLIRSKNLQNVALCGHVDDLRDLWEKATFGIFPSRYEGIPLAMIEGMSLGRAAVATDVAGHAEWIKEGETGFLAAAPSMASLDEALENAWNARDRADLLGEEARVTASEMLNPEPEIVLANLIESFP